MLVLSRHVGEKVRIGNEVTVMVVELRGDKVRLAFDAPPDVAIHREEVWLKIKKGGSNESSK